jgi:hypothetical protein
MAISENRYDDNEPDDNEPGRYRPGWLTIIISLIVLLALLASLFYPLLQVGFRRQPLPTREILPEARFLTVFALG